jgi:hypothetical protein
MANILDYKIILALTLSLLLNLTALACSCADRLTTEQEYKRSDLVIQGRIIGADTIYSSNTLIHDKKGIKVGRHKFSIYSEKFLRIKMVVQKNFKSNVNLPDTIYILTSPENDACGYPFASYLDKGVLPDSYYQYIIYGDKWAEKSIIKYKKGKKYIRQIKERLLEDTFFTSRCRRTQSANEEEHKNLSKLLH